MDYYHIRSHNRNYLQHMQCNFLPYVRSRSQLLQSPTFVYVMPISTSSKSTPQQRNKSKAQKLRDQKRRERFIESKTICSAMPFYEISNDELSKCMPKTVCQATCDITQLCFLESVLNTAVKELNAIQEENKKLTDSNSSLHVCLSEEQGRLRKAERQILLCTEETEKLRKGLSAEKEQTGLLTKDLGEERDRREMYQDACEERLDMLKSLREKLSLRDSEYSALRKVLERTSESDEKSISKLNFKIKELQTELEGKKVSEYKCNKCGMKDVHPPENCAAYGNICKNCQNEGHFTKFCDFICNRCDTEEYHAPNSCIPKWRISGGYAIRGPPVDTRLFHGSSRPNERRRQGRRR